MSRKGLALFAAFILFGSIVMMNGLGFGAPAENALLISPSSSSSFPTMSKIPFFSYAPTDAAVNIPDGKLKAKLHTLLGIAASTPIYKSDLAKLTGGLDLSGAQIAKVEGLQYCDNITALNLADNKIADLPSSFKPANLQTLILDDNSFTKMPDALFTIPKLTSLSIKGCKITKVPDKINMLPLLSSLDLSGNDIESISTNIQKLTNLINLNLARNGIKDAKLPKEIFLLPALATLDLSGNTLSELPVQVATMPKLTVLNVEGNILDALPAGLGNAPCLQQVYAARNRLKIIESTLLNGKITNLTLDVNRITDLPQGLAGKTFDTFTVEWNFIDMSEGSEARKIADSVIAPSGKGYLRQLKPLPVNADYSATTTTVTLSWQPLEDGTEGDSSWKVNKYQIYLDKNGSWVNLSGSPKTIADLDRLSTQYVIAGLKADTAYKFQVGVEYSLNLNGQKVTHRVYVPVEAKTLAEGATAAPTEEATAAPPTEGTVSESATPALEPSSTPVAAASAGSSNTLVVILIIVVAVLLIALILLGSLFLSRRGRSY